MSSHIKVRFFASLAEAVGTAEIFVEASDTQMLMEVLADRLSADAMQAIQQDNVRIAVNQTLIEGLTPLTASDEVALLPPITGG